MSQGYPGPSNPYQPPQVPAGQPMFPPGAGSGGTPFAPCPSCGNGYATKVSFTWWGGLIGPKLFSHVKCNRCGTAYNGKTGKSNTTNIVIYTVVLVVIGLVLGALSYGFGG